jgi:hypothetical protein
VGSRTPTASSSPTRTFTIPLRVLISSRRLWILQIGRFVIVDW